MQGAIVMLMALSGLGCDNPSSHLDDLPTSGSPIVSRDVNPVPTPTTPLPYSRSYVPVSGDTEIADTTHSSVLRSTLYSFVLGHDPDVMTAREIEASAYGYGYRDQGHQP